MVAREVERFIGTIEMHTKSTGREERAIWRQRHCGNGRTVPRTFLVQRAARKSPAPDHGIESPRRRDRTVSRQRHTGYGSCGPAKKRRGIRSRARMRRSRYRGST